MIHQCRLSSFLLGETSKILISSPNRTPTSDSPCRKVTMGTSNLSAELKPKAILSTPTGNKKSPSATISKWNSQSGSKFLMKTAKRILNSLARPIQLWEISWVPTTKQWYLTLKMRRGRKLGKLLFVHKKFNNLHVFCHLMIDSLKMKWKGGKIANVDSFFDFWDKSDPYLKFMKVRQDNTFI